jgi:adenine-specific DNA-methyltransferase
MIFVNYEDIKVPENRFRKKFPEAADAELADSIRRIGLLHPPTVERDGDTWILRAGERRLRLLKRLLGEGHKLHCGGQELSGSIVPCIELQELTPLQRLEVEVEENVLRLDFDFRERAAAIAALHELRTLQNPAQTASDTAEEAVGRREATEVNNAIIITQHANDPDVAKAKNAKEALAAIRKKAEAIRQVQLAGLVDTSKIKHRIILGDAVAVLPTLPEKSFDVILTDPIYGVGADNFGTQSATGHDYEDSPTAWEKLFRAIPDQLTRVAKDRAHCYLFCDPRRFERLTALMVLANWTVFPTPLVWYKWGSGMLPFPEHGPRRTYETILYAYKGDRRTLVVKSDCIVNIPPVRNLRNAAQKPVALYCDLLSRSASPGDTVLDFSGGSGTILPAANIRKLTATYIELDEGQYNIALTRAQTQEVDDGAQADDGLKIDFGLAGAGDAR